MSIEATDAVVRAWKPPVPGIREVLHARFTEHAYPPHTHDAWTLFVVDDGAVDYDLDRRPRSATPTLASILPPCVTHDGRPATSGGYRKRVVYLEPELLEEARIGQAVDVPALPDPDLRDAVVRLLDALDCAADALEAETRLAFIVERVQSVWSATPGVADTDTRDAAVPRRDLAEALRAFLDARLTEPVTLRAATAALGASESVLARSFTRDLGIPPHAYVIGRRLDLARARILAGEALAVVATDTGFFDQAHLTRAFKRFLGTTPGRFAAAR